MNNLIGSDDIKNQEIQSVNKLLNSVKQENPTYFKKFNFTIHKKGHISAQQAMFQILARESEKMNENGKSSSDKNKK